MDAKANEGDAKMLKMLIKISLKFTIITLI